MMQTYEHYKDSGIDWIGPIPEHWDLIKLKHIFREKPKTLNPTLSAGSISFGKVIYKNDEKIPESTKASYQEVLAGDFLINPLNLNYDLISLRIALSTINVVVSSGYIVLQDIIDINKDFYKWFLHQYDVSYMKLLGSGVRQTINFNHIANSLLAFPPIHEQEAIANFLDEKTAKIDALVQTKVQQIEKLKELRQAKIHQAVTKGISDTERSRSVEMKDSGVEWIGEIPEHWEVKNFRRISRLQQGFQIPIDKRLEEYQEGSYEYITTKSVHNPNDPKHYILNPPKNVICVEDDILMGRTGNTGEVVTNVKGVFHNNFFKIKYNNDLIKRFLVHYLNLKGIKNEIMLSAGTTTIPDLNHNSFLSLFVIIPPIQEQEQIVTYLDEVTGKIDQAIAQKQEQITQLKEYKQSLINDVVTGKVRVC